MNIIYYSPSRRSGKQDVRTSERDKNICTCGILKLRSRYIDENTPHLFDVIRNLNFEKKEALHMDMDGWMNKGIVDREPHSINILRHHAGYKKHLKKHIARSSPEELVLSHMV